MKDRIKGPRGVKAKPECFVVHTAEGCRTAECIIDFVAPRGIGVPYAADGDKTLRMTPDGYLGDNHAGGLDTKASGVELAGFAGWTRRVWLGETEQWGKAPREMVRAAGRLAAYELGKHYRVTKRMLCKRLIGHAQDEQFGGSSDHWDPGLGFPYDVCVNDALEWAGAGAIRLKLSVAGDVARAQVKKATAAVRETAERFGLVVSKPEKPKKLHPTSDPNA